MVDDFLHRARPLTGLELYYELERATPLLAMGGELKAAFHELVAALDGGLRHVAGNLHRVACGVSSIEGNLTILAAVPMVNRTLDDIAGALPFVARAAKAKAARR